MKGGSTECRAGGVRTQEFKFERLGVFAYSEEDGTPAASMDEQAHPIPRNILEGLVLQLSGRDVSKQKLAKWRVAKQLPAELLDRLAAAYEVRTGTQ